MFIGINLFYEYLLVYFECIRNYMQYQVVLIMYVVLEYLLIFLD